MHFDRKLILKKKTDKVKTVDLHPSEPWILSSHYNGTASITNYITGATVRTFAVSDSPVRVGKFLAHKNWVIVGSDDCLIRIFNYNSGKKICQLEGHTDYIRDIEVHPTRPLFLSCSDDQTIRQWSYSSTAAATASEDFVQQQRCHEGHEHFVMSITINPKDPNSFASCSLDRTIKTWSLSMSSPLQTIQNAHEKGCNWITYYNGSPDKPYLLSAGDDALIKVWDSQNKSLIKTLLQHTDNVSSIIFHPTQPFLLSVSEDGCMLVWKMPSFQLQEIVPLEIGSLWNVSFSATTTANNNTSNNNNVVAICGDDGFVVFEVKRQVPPVSLNGSKLFYTQNTSEVVSCNLSLSLFTDNQTDGEVLNLNPLLKDHGALDFSSVQALIHSPNGRYIAALGDEQFNIHSTLGFRSKCFGSSEQLVWATGPAASERDTFAVVQDASSIVVYENFEESKRFTIPFSSCDATITIFGGPLLGVMKKNSVSFHDWNTLELIRRMEVPDTTSLSWAPQPMADGWWKLLIGSSEGKQVTYILKYNPLHSKDNPAADGGGYEDSFIFITEVPSMYFQSSAWLDGDVFIFCNPSTPTNTFIIQYLLGDGHIGTICSLKKGSFIVGLLQSGGSGSGSGSITNLTTSTFDSNVSVKLLLSTQCSNKQSFYTHTIPIAVLMFEQRILAGDYQAAKETLLPLITGEGERDKLSLFLKNYYTSGTDGTKCATKDPSLIELALSLATDVSTKFSLSLILGDVDLSYRILTEDAGAGSLKNSNNRKLWSLLADLALETGKWDVGEECLKRTKSWGRLLLFYVAKNSSAAIREVGEWAYKDGQLNVAFTAFYRCGDWKKCYHILLVDQNRPWEAVIFGRSHSVAYGDAFSQWKESLPAAKAALLEEVDGCHDVDVDVDVIDFGTTISSFKQKNVDDAFDDDQSKRNDSIDTANLSNNDINSYSKEELDTLAPLPLKGGGEAESSTGISAAGAGASGDGDENFSIDVNYDSINGGSLCSDDYAPNATCFPGDPAPEPVMDFDDDDDDNIDNGDCVDAEGSFSFSKHNVIDGSHVDDLLLNDDFNNVDLNDDHLNDFKNDPNTSEIFSDTVYDTTTTTNTFVSTSQVEPEGGIDILSVDHVDINFHSPIEPPQFYQKSDDVHNFKIPPPPILLKDDDDEDDNSNDYDNNNGNNGTINIHDNKNNIKVYNDDPLDLGDLKEGLEGGWN